LGGASTERACWLVMEQSQQLSRDTQQQVVYETAGVFEQPSGDSMLFTLQQPATPTQNAEV
jgi:hypothetical protein